MGFVLTLELQMVKCYIINDLYFIHKTIPKQYHESLSLTLKTKGGLVF